MQKVVGSSPISRLIGSPLVVERVFCFLGLARTTRHVFWIAICAHLSPNIAALDERFETVALTVATCHLLRVDAQGEVRIAVPELPTT
jgi:hypothetical protein